MPAGRLHARWLAEAAYLSGPSAEYTSGISYALTPFSLKADISLPFFPASLVSRTCGAAGISWATRSDAADLLQWLDKLCCLADLAGDTRKHGELWFEAGRTSTLWLLQWESLWWGPVKLCKCCICIRLAAENTDRSKDHLICCAQGWAKASLQLTCDIVASLTNKSGLPSRSQLSTRADGALRQM